MRFERERVRAFGDCAGGGNRGKDGADGWQRHLPRPHRPYQVAREREKLK
jgi:hypothetical protein